jgi:hypothetical protein
VYIPDGSPYTYGPVPEDVRAVAVAWLDAAHPYGVGRVDGTFVDRLLEACREHATARTRGYHPCPFCSAEGPSPTTFARDGKSLSLGDAEVRVVAEDGTWLVAPTLVLHYVAEHSYQPPPAFVEAVCARRFAPS